MSGFIAWLENQNQKGTKVRAVLRRSLSVDPGAYPAAFPYVEPFIKGEENSWRRDVHYLVAGLWALCRRSEERGDPVSLGAATAALYEIHKRSPSIERRFITLLDSDRDQLPYRLRQMVALLKEYSLDFESMLKELLYWNSERKTTQNQWAKDFYRNLREENENQTDNNQESEI